MGSISVACYKPRPGREHELLSGNRREDQRLERSLMPTAFNWRSSFRMTPKVVRGHS
jgi:hypothetical protein